MKLSLMLLLVVLICGVAAGQDLQVGTKACPATFVAYLAGASPVPNARQDIEVAFQSLWTACLAANLHPLCVPSLAFDISAMDTGTMQWEVQFMLADQLDPQNLPQKDLMRIRQVPETRVAYRYATGEPWQAMETAFGDLHKWAVDQGLPVTTKARAVVYVGMFAQQLEQIVSECQLELRQ